LDEGQGMGRVGAQRFDDFENPDIWVIDSVMALVYSLTLSGLNFGFRIWC
jgi:hypothetical protein